MRNVFIVFFLSAIPPCMINAQSTIRKGVMDIDAVIYKHFNAIDTLVANRPTEFVQLAFEVDSNGSMSAIHIAGTDTGFAYEIFKMLELQQFKDWKCYDCRNKIVVIPFFYFSKHTQNYIDVLFREYYSKIPREELFTISGKVIRVKFLYATGIGEVKNYPASGKVIIIGPTKINCGPNARLLSVLQKLLPYNKIDCEDKVDKSVSNQ